MRESDNNLQPVLSPLVLRAPKGWNRTDSIVAGATIAGWAVVVSALAIYCNKAGDAWIGIALESWVFFGSLLLCWITKRLFAQHRKIFEQDKTIASYAIADSSLGQKQSIASKGSIRLEIFKACGAMVLVWLASPRVFLPSLAIWAIVTLLAPHRPAGWSRAKVLLAIGINAIPISLVSLLGNDFAHYQSNPLVPILFLGTCGWAVLLLQLMFWLLLWHRKLDVFVSAREESIAKHEEYVIETVKGQTADELSQLISVHTRRGEIAIADECSSKLLEIMEPETAPIKEVPLNTETPHTHAEILNPEHSHEDLAGGVLRLHEKEKETWKA